MTSVAVIWLCIGGALVAILVLGALQLGRTPTRKGPGSRTAGAPSGDDDPPESATLDPDDEKVAFSDRRRFPARKWDPMTGAATDDPDDAIDEDDRAPTDRPSHPTNRWERD